MILGIICGAGLLVLLLAIIAGGLSIIAAGSLILYKTANGNSQSVLFMPVYDSEEGRTNIVQYNRQVGYVEGEIRQVASDREQMNVLVLNQDREAYLCNGYKVTKISEDVSGRTVVSENGKAFLLKDEQNTLYLVDAKGKQVEIATQVWTDDYVISPDGKSVVYFKEDNLYLYQNKETEQIGKNMIPLAVSNKAKYIYAVGSKKTDSLYLVSKDGEKTKISSNLIYPYIWVNSGFTEVLFWTEDATYMSFGGRNKEKVCEAHILPVENAYTTPERHNRVIHSELKTLENAVAYETAEFANIYGRAEKNYNNTNLYVINRLYTAEEMIEDVEQCRMVNGKKIYYLSQRNLCRQSAKKSAKPEILAENVRDYWCSNDRTTLYYLAEDGRLYYYCSNGEDQMIAEGIIRENVQMSRTGALYYLNPADRGLYMAKRKEKPVLVRENTDNLLKGKNNVYFFDTGADDAKTKEIYMEKHSGKFKLICSFTP